MLRRIYITLSRLLPKGYMEDTRAMIRYAGFDVDAEVWVGRNILTAVIVALMVLYFSRGTSPLVSILLAAAGFAVYMIGTYNIPFLIAERRAEKVEDVLPSALQLMSSNIRAGMTPFQAMKLAARPEFGLLQEEMNKATTKALGTSSFSDALREMSSRIKLPTLDRSVRLFVRSIESGGPLARILEETARDISDNILLRRELVSSTRTYTLLILITVLFGAPLLLNVSVHFTERLSEMRSSLSVASVETLGLSSLLGGETISPEFLVDISAIVVIVTAFIASLLIGVIVKGEEKYGLKYAVFLVPLTTIIFYLIRYIVKLALG